MANFTPAGKIKIGRVPFDNSYRHTLTFSSVEEQTAYFSSVCTESLENDSYTYIRMNNTIRVPFNAERLYTYDYVMYQNSNYGTKWFYAFIVDINYVNENMTELVLELDVMQTWYFDYQLVEGFVEREHVNDDTIGAHLNAEPGMDLQYKYSLYDPHKFDVRSGYMVVLVNAMPYWTNWEDTAGSELDHGKDCQNATGSYPLAGGVYQGFPNGVFPLLYKLNVTKSMNAFIHDMRWYNQVGIADTICDMYCIPSEAIYNSDVIPLRVKVVNEDYSDQTPDRAGQIGRPREYVWTVGHSHAGVEQDASHPRPLSLDGYVPRNNKLLCYPYTYLELGDFSGRTEDLRWEYFVTDSDGNVPMTCRLQGISDHIGYILPYGYNNAYGPNGNWQPHTTKPFTFSFANKVSWVYSAYQTWNAQNLLTNELTVLGGTLGTALTVPFGIDSAVKAYGASKSRENFWRGLGANEWGNHIAENRPRQVKNAFSHNMNHYPGYAGMMGIAAAAGNAYKMAHVPNTTKGNTAGNSKMQNGFLGWYKATVCIRREFAQIMDDFFDCYGYSIERVKVPNRTGRRSWNYVKMENACHRGNVPADDMEKINSIYDSGITFWHTTDVGNYSLDNSIV